jgi:hypothetical protein
LFPFKKVTLKGFVYKIGIVYKVAGRPSSFKMFVNREKSPAQCPSAMTLHSRIRFALVSFTIAQFIQSSTKAMRERLARAAPVIMQKDDTRILTEHMIVQGNYFQIIFPQCFDD